MAANPMNNKNLGRTHSKELAKNNRGKRTRKNSDYQTAATAARQAQAQSQAARKAPWPTKVIKPPIQVPVSPKKEISGGETGVTVNEAVFLQLYLSISMT